MESFHKNRNQDLFVVLGNEESRKSLSASVLIDLAFRFNFAKSKLCLKMGTRLQNQERVPENLRKQLALAVRSIQWSYAIFWSISPRQPGYLFFHLLLYLG